MLRCVFKQYQNGREPLLILFVTPELPSGKHTKNYGTSLCLMGKLTINGSFSIANCCLPEGMMNQFIHFSEFIDIL